ncbi:MAG: hypothetical protein C4343_07755, partial [Chloroflexota bacterium]
PWTLDIFSPGAHYLGGTGVGGLRKRVDDSGPSPIEPDPSVTPSPLWDGRGSSRPDSQTYAQATSGCPPRQSITPPVTLTLAILPAPPPRSIGALEPVRVS